MVTTRQQQKRKLIQQHKRKFIYAYLCSKGWKHIYVKNINAYVWVKGVYVINTNNEALELQKKWDEEDIANGVVL